MREVLGMNVSRRSPGWSRLSEMFENLLTSALALFG